MGKVRVGNKQNSFLNGEWGGHVSRWEKKLTARIRRILGKKVITEELNNK